MKNVNVILFDDFTLLDVFGPVDVFSRMDSHYRIDYYSHNGGKVKTKPNFEIETKSFNDISGFDILMIPGGFGTRKLVYDSKFISDLKNIAEKSEKVMTVCTGSALLAKTGLLKNIKATSNKMSYDWVTGQDSDVKWIRKARWVADGKYYSSSGITAGIDMALGFINDMIGGGAADKISHALEYVWNNDSEEDPFA
ncbi:MAG: DJ-1/PfpI family protein [Spirochaetes bacterium]|nr:DJ-1/PfpI family protein [Spirochaetota bacterium]